jgi:predicted nucleotidyltransferase
MRTMLLIIRRGNSLSRQVAMEPHHAASIDNLVRALEPDPSILALVLAGSIAHGFAMPDSDIDVAIVVEADEYRRRRREGSLTYVNAALCTYPGYVDGKYVDLDFLRLVAERGSDPARFAFVGSRILFSRIPDLETLLADITRYPADQKRARTDRFVAQLVAWRWYYSEAARHRNRYLHSLALQKLVLFGCRIVLNENELLYPFHKWLLRVVKTAPRQPAGFMASIEQLLTDDSSARVEAFSRDVLAFAGVDPAEVDAVWASRFMRDTELSWIAHEAPIDDL